MDLQEKTLMDSQPVFAIQLENTEREILMDH